MRERYILMALAGFAITLLVGVVLGIRIGRASVTPASENSADPANVRIRQATAPAPPPPGPTLFELDSRLNDKRLTEFQRQQYLQSVIGTLVTAKGTVGDIRPATATGSDEIWLNCSGLTGDAKSALVVAYVSPTTAKVLASLQKGQVITVVGQLQEFRQSDPSLFWGPKYSNGIYQLGMAEIAQ